MQPKPFNEAILNPILIKNYHSDSMVNCVLILRVPRKLKKALKRKFMFSVSGKIVRVTCEKSNYKRPKFTFCITDPILNNFFFH